MPPMTKSAGISPGGRMVAGLAAVELSVHVAPMAYPDDIGNQAIALKDTLCDTQGIIASY